MTGMDDELKERVLMVWAALTLVEYDDRTLRRQKLQQPRMESDILEAVIEAKDGLRKLLDMLWETNAEWAGGQGGI